MPFERSTMAETQPKRRRLDSRYELKKKRRREATSGSKAVEIDALPWGQAKLPDRLDDAEGFFGLEEISDVEVVRDPTSGRVEYRVGEVSWEFLLVKGSLLTFPSCLNRPELPTLRLAASTKMDNGWKRTPGAVSVNRILETDPLNRSLDRTTRNRPQHRFQRRPIRKQQQSLLKATYSTCYEMTLSMMRMVSADDC